jgi:RimJ/RimL family protein N-acetyltransferase
MNADPRVMEFLPKLLTRDQSDAMADRIEQHFAEHGFGLWAVERRGVAAFLGYTGLSIPRFTAHFTPCVEIGWRLAAEHWGRSYATEAARAAVRYAFEELNVGWVDRAAATHQSAAEAMGSPPRRANPSYDARPLDEIVSFTVPQNVRSRRVMEKLGMTHDPSDDFDHPLLPPRPPLQPPRPLPPAAGWVVGRG